MGSSPELLRHEGEDARVGPDVSSWMSVGEWGTHLKRCALLIVAHGRSSKYSSVRAGALAPRGLGQDWDCGLSHWITYLAAERARVRGEVDCDTR